jgi:hypothetical protein
LSVVVSPETVKFPPTVRSLVMVTLPEIESVPVALGEICDSLIFGSDICYPNKYPPKVT